MDKATPEQLLHRLLSLRDNAWNSGDASEFQALETQIARLRKQYAAQLDHHGAALRAALERQGRLLESINAGKISAERANTENRRIVHEIEAQRAAIARYNQLARAQSPGDLPEMPETAAHTPAAPVPPARVALPGPRWLSAEDRQQIAVAAVLLVVAVLGTVYLLVGRDGMHFDASVIPGPPETIRIMCVNSTLNPVMLFVPRTDSGGGNTAGTYGIDVYIRESGAKDFRLVSGAGDCWSQQGVPLERNEPLSVGPGLILELRLNVNRLVERFPATESVQLLCTRGIGGTEFAFTHPVAKENKKK